MKRTVIIIFFLVTGLAFQIQARHYKGFSIGANAAGNNYKKLDFEGFAQVNFLFGHVPFEPKIGFAFRSFTANYRGLSELDVHSVGLFMGIDTYPFSKIFFTGLHFEMDLNRFDKKAMRELANSNVFFTRSFPGYRIQAVAGLDIPINERISLRISGMPGWQFYVLSDNWEVSTGGGTINISTRNGNTYSKFVYQLNVGMAIKLWKNK